MTHYDRKSVRPKVQMFWTDNGGNFKSKELIKFCLNTASNVNIRLLIVRSRIAEQIKKDNSGTNSVHVPTLRTVGWLLGRGTTNDTTQSICRRVGLYDFKLKNYGPKARWITTSWGFSYALISKNNRYKLELRSRKCIFLGYGEIKHRFWDPKKRKIVRSSDIVFNKSAMHKTIERCLEVQMVTFSKVPTLHDGSTHNRRSASPVAESSIADSAQPNDSALDHLIHFLY